MSEVDADESARTPKLGTPRPRARVGSARTLAVLAHAGKHRDKPRSRADRGVGVAGLQEKPRHPLPGPK